MPTTNFVLHWVTGRTESHRYDESLRSIDLVTKDAYEPTLPLSVVVHIDYQKAPNVIQRFGDVKKLITQTLDPMLSAYFRDVAHKRTMLELLQDRDSIQHESSNELGRKFHNFDIECVDVLIGKPDTEQAGGKIETLLEQLRLRQLSLEQVETYSKQVTAAQNLRVLNEAQAQAQMQTQLSNSLVQIRSPRTRPRRSWPGPASRPSRWSSRPRPRASSESWPAAAKVRGSCRKGCPKRRSCSARSVVLGPAALRPVGRGPEPGQVHPAAGPRAGLHRRRRRRGTARPATAGGNRAGALARSGLMGLLLSMLVAEKSGFQLVDQPGGIGAAGLHRKGRHARPWSRSSRPSATTRPRRCHHGNGGNGHRSTPEVAVASSRQVAPRRPGDPPRSGA